MDIIRKNEGFKNQKIVIFPSSVFDDYKNIPIINNLYITDIGFFPNAKHHYIGRVYGSKEYLLILCIKGEGFARVGEKNLILKEGDLVILPPNVSHTYGSSSKKPWDILFIHFKGDYCNYYFKDFDCTNTISLTLDNKVKLRSLIFDLISLLEKGCIESNLAYSSQCLSYILSLLLLNNSSSTSYLDSSIKYIDMAVDYMKQNINDTLTLDDIANNIGLSRSHTSLIFKQKTNRSPIDFFIQLKIQHSCGILKYSTLSIKEIASSLGYEDQYYFSRVFKKVIGMSPAQYRKENIK